MEEKVKEDLNKAMDEIAVLNKDGVVVQGGKRYTQVVVRMEVFRRRFGLDYGIDTDVLFPAEGGIIVKAKVTGEGNIIGSGMAYATEMSKEKCLEKLETTAVGRALASIGLSGGEYCSQNELDTYEERYEEITAEQREQQLEAIDGLYDYETLVEFDEYKPDISNLPEILLEAYKDQRNTILNLLYFL